MLISMNDTYITDTNRLIRNYMALRGIDQKELAIKLSMHPVSLSARLTGKTPFRANEIVEIAKILNVTPNDLLISNSRDMKNA